MNWGMKMTERNHMADESLDGLFEAAKRDAPLPDSSLLARVLADANEAQAGFVMPLAAPAPKPRGASFEGLFQALGGWGGLSGLTAASAFGLWLGMSPVLGLSDGLTEGLGLPSFGTAATLESLGTDYDYLAGLGEV